MPKVNNFPVVKLRQDELFGFFNETRWQITHILVDVPDWANPFIDSVKAFDIALSPADEGPSAQLLDKADKSVDEAWGGANAFFRAMVRHPVTEIREAAEYCLSIFARYENPTSKGYASEYAQMERLVSALTDIPQQYRTTIGADPWIDQLRQCCDRFSALYRDRVQTTSDRPTGLSTTTRKQAIAAYRAMVEHMNALLLVSPSPLLEQLATRMNRIIDQNNAVLKSRKTAAGNKDDDKDENKETETSNTAAQTADK